MDHVMTCEWEVVVVMSCVWHQLCAAPLVITNPCAAVVVMICVSQQVAPLVITNPCAVVVVMICVSQQVVPLVITNPCATHMEDWNNTSLPIHMKLWGGRLVGSLKLYVSFAKEPYKRDDILQKRPVILRSLLIIATR